MPINLPGRIRYLIVCLSGFLMLCIALAAMWYQDAQYAAPTPRPKGLRQPLMSERISLPPEVLDGSASNGRPVLLHFFNPECPCSRFNLDHVRRLIATYGSRMRVVAVLQGGDEARLRHDFRATGLQIPAMADTRGEIARECGVYSTPQAVILTGDRRLYFRGNYNLSRYCDNADTEFARLAIESLLGAKPRPNFPPAATVPYGCLLPAYDRRGSSR